MVRKAYRDGWSATLLWVNGGSVTRCEFEFLPYAALATLGGLRKGSIHWDGVNHVMESVLFKGEDAIARPLQGLNHYRSHPGLQINKNTKEDKKEKKRKKTPDTFLPLFEALVRDAVQNCSLGLPDGKEPDVSLVRTYCVALFDIVLLSVKSNKFDNKVFKAQGQEVKKTDLKSKLSAVFVDWQVAVEEIDFWALNCTLKNGTTLKDVLQAFFMNATKPPDAAGEDGAHYFEAWKVPENIASLTIEGSETYKKQKARQQMNYQGNKAT